MSVPEVPTVVDEPASSAPTTSPDLDSQEPAKLSPEERTEKLSAAEACKTRGNSLYSSQEYDAAQEQYEEAIAVAPEDAHQQLSIYWANIGACHLQMSRVPDCVHACSTALTFNPQYIKALTRRSTAYEKLDELDKALKDAEQILEYSPDDAWAQSTSKRLRPVVDERHEKLKEETLGKLKELGNSILGKFGMSLDSFAMEQDPNSGGYSIKFKN